MAMATAASAAAIAIKNKVKNTPSNLSANKYLLKAIKLMLTRQTVRQQSLFVRARLLFMVKVILTKSIMKNRMYLVALI